MLLLVVHDIIHRREITDHAPEAIYNNCSRDALSIFLWHGNPKRSKMSISLVGDTHPNLQQYRVYQEHSENESYKFMNVCMSREEHPTLNWILAAATPNYKLLVIPYTSITQQGGVFIKAPSCKHYKLTTQMEASISHSQTIKSIIQNGNDEVTYTRKGLSRRIRDGSSTIRKFTSFRGIGCIWFHR